MPKKVIPEHSRVMRTAAWMWMVYLASLAVVDMFIYTGAGGGHIIPVIWYHLLNGIPALIFLGLAYSSWLEKYYRVFIPLMILSISAGPILLNHLFDLRLPQAPLSNIEGMIIRQLPILFIGLVLVAWHYQLTTMIIYSVGTNFLELLVVSMLNRPNDPRLVAFYFIIVIRTVCFVLVGIFINQLIKSLRAQQDSLKTANNQLTHYASTLESLTVSRERNRMSRELHDTVVHTLSGLSVQLETARAYWKVNPETAKTLLDQSLEATRAGLQETRRAIKALRASPLDDLGLTNAIQKITELAAERGRLILDVRLPESNLILSPDVEQCIYRITQEAVENVVQHANAKHLTVKLATREKDIELLIQDDGMGFRAAAHSPNGHFGLAGMRERAQLVGGELTTTNQTHGAASVQLIIKGCIQ